MVTKRRIVELRKAGSGLFTGLSILIISQSPWPILDWTQLANM
jgi:hypothetical protein